MQDKLQAAGLSAHNTHFAASDSAVHDVDFACAHRSVGVSGALQFNQGYSPALTRPQSKDAS